LRAVTAAFAQRFENVDCLVGGVLPVAPPRIGETMVVINGTDVSVVDAFTRLNAPQNMAGIPALSVPCGKANGLPVGLQIIGASGHDEAVLRLGAAFQQTS
jgi:aspartyl-tRNA(Asn)/glutamyl-tRNA(Gln) amidotransferase subunit A